jgi:exportin-5
LLGSGKYLESFLTFATHPSQFLSPDPLLLAIISKYLHASMTNLIEMNFPSKTSLVINIDFHSDEGVDAFFSSSQVQQREEMR